MGVEKIHGNRIPGPFKVVQNIGKIRFYRIGQHEAVVEPGSPAHQPLPIRMIPEPGDTGAQQKLLERKTRLEAAIAKQRSLEAALEDTRPAVPVRQAPKPPPERVSLGLDTLRSASERIVLVAGQDKRDALRRIGAGERLPIALVGPLLWFMDAAAAG